jgi:uncharacterized protein (DUF1697 family)
MKTYIALLRGINVSGHKLIKMELLRKVLAELHFKNIRTYIQSGNIIFDAATLDHKTLENQIGAKIEEHFGFQVPVVIVTLEELKSVVSKNPFTETEIPDPTQPYVAFLSDAPSAENNTAFSMMVFGKDRFTIADKNIYLLYPDSAANAKLSNAIIETKLKVKATSRNWKTILKLIELVENPA